MIEDQDRFQVGASIRTRRETMTAPDFADVVSVVGVTLAHELGIAEDLLIEYRKKPYFGTVGGDLFPDDRDKQSEFDEIWAAATELAIVLRQNPNPNEVETMILKVARSKEMREALGKVAQLLTPLKTA